MHPHHDFERTSPSPGTPGEGRGEGPHPTLSRSTAEYRERAFRANRGTCRAPMPVERRQIRTYCSASPGPLAELADATDSKSVALKACGFESHEGHWVNGGILFTFESR